MYHKCPDCRGSGREPDLGYLDDNNPCWGCDGTGIEDTRTYMDSAEGVHLMVGCGTLCGEMRTLQRTHKKCVTCDNCIHIIDECRGVRTRSEPKPEGDLLWLCDDSEIH